MPSSAFVLPRFHIQLVKIDYNIDMNIYDTLWNEVARNGPFCFHQKRHRATKDDNYNDNDSDNDTATNNDNDNNYNQVQAWSTTREIPIFPLRKFPRFPTDRLTLNLYEERYLQMADCIITSPLPCFGAIYVAGKPQLVTGGGSGPIVPLLQPGDIGTLFRITNSHEDLLSMNENNYSQRKIKLDAIGIARFRITRIVSDGTLVSGVAPRSTEQRPFIRADVTLLGDEQDPTSKLRTRYKYNEILQSLQRSTSDSIDPLLEFTQVYSAIAMMNDELCHQYNYDELFSFFALSRLVNAKKSPSKLISFLESQSTEERITSLLDKIRE